MCGHNYVTEMNMLLVSAKVGPFKSINEPQSVAINDAVTVFVGMNEAGKTVFLRALEKSRDALGLAAFDPVDDYPRKDLPSYLKQQRPDCGGLTGTTALLLCNALSQTCDARLWGCSQNRTTLTLCGCYCSCF